MRVLGIESSSLVASVAIVTDGILTAEYTVNLKKTHSQTLLPMIDEVIRMLEIELDTIDAIAVSGGPGSFTGLRIGSATAKGLGLAMKKPLIHVPTVDAMAYNLYGTDACGGVKRPGRAGDIPGRRSASLSGGYRRADKGSPQVCPSSCKPAESRFCGSPWQRLPGGGKDGNCHGAQAGLPEKIPGGERTGTGGAPGRAGQAGCRNSGSGKAGVGRNIARI